MKLPPRVCHAIRSRSRLRLRPLALFAAVLVPLACGGGATETGGGSGASARTDILLSDAPADELLAFQATIVDLRLDDDVGGSTPNLLSGSLPQEFIGLQSKFAWLSNHALPPGTYTAVRIGFRAGSYSARRNDGIDVAVNAVSNVLVAPLRTPLVVDPSGYSRVVVDLDLVGSLSGSVASPPLVFDPQGSCVHDDGSAADSIDEVKGIVSSVDAGSNNFVIDAFVDDEGAIPLGQVTVSVSGTTVLVQDDGTLFSSQSLFFGTLSPGTTAVEVHGTLQGGALQATRVEIEDNAAGGGNAHLVKIRGRILDIGPANELEMSIAEVDDGSSIVSAAFGGTIPGTLHVNWGPDSVFFLAEQAPTTSASLAIGEEVHVKFPVFANAPFLASRIEIEDEAVEFEGHVTSIAGLPTSFVMHLEADDPAVLSGEVASTATDVVVGIAASAILLDVEGDPALTAASLLPGQKIQPAGVLSGPPNGPTIIAVRTKIFAGRLRDATVAAVARANHTFEATGGEIDDPFGGGVVAGDLTVAIQAGAVFSGDASTETGFFDLFDGLQEGETLSVEVRGIGAGSSSSVLGYEIDARVQS